MRRPWRIEFQYWNWNNISAASDLPEIPWHRYRSSFATREAAERHVTSGDLGYYLSFARRHEYRIVNVDSPPSRGAS